MPKLGACPLMSRPRTKWKKNSGTAVGRTRSGHSALISEVKPVLVCGWCNERVIPTKELNVGVIIPWLLLEW